MNQTVARTASPAAIPTATPNQKAGDSPPPLPALAANKDADPLRAIPAGTRTAIRRLLFTKDSSPHPNISFG